MITNLEKQMQTIAQKVSKDAHILGLYALSLEELSNGKGNFLTKTSIVQ
jgi:hypothetical protein